MSNPPIPTNPNITTGANTGRVVTDRYDFESHLEGSNFRHKANQIDLFPTVVIGTTKTTVQDAIVALTASLTIPAIPDATTISKGAVQLAGDIGGTASSVSVIALKGYPLASIPPSITGQVLTWNGSAWQPQAVSNAFTFAGDVTGTAGATTVVKINGKPVVASAPNPNDVLTWQTGESGSFWGPLPINASIVAYGGGNAWADGTTNPATFVDLQLNKIINDLAATTGDVKIGSPARSSSPVSLSSGSVGSQIAALLAALNSFENQKGQPSGLANLDVSGKLLISELNVNIASGVLQLDGSAKVPSAQLNINVANGIAGLDGSSKVLPAQLNMGVANGLATLDGSVKLTTAQRAGWIVSDGYLSDNNYGSILTTFSTTSFADGYFTVTLTGLLIGDVVRVNMTSGVSSAAAGGGEFKVVANSNGGSFVDVPGTIMRSFNTGSNNPANPVDRWAVVSKYTVTANGSVIVKTQGRTITGAGNSFINGSGCLYCSVYRP
jgi:hypothetical protein